MRKERTKNFCHSKENTQISLKFRANTTGRKSQDMKEMKLVKAWKNNLRGWEILWKLNPYLFIAYTVDALLGALLPYTTIWISAQIIGELAGGRNTQILFKWVMAEIIVSLILGILKYAKVLPSILHRCSNCPKPI